MNQHGISLVLHNGGHLQNKAPSGRIFEAAAAAAVIISDEHAFVKREFKNSVLYIDHRKFDLFSQIEKHMQWIKANPEKARAMAEKAHQIFLQKFTLEDQLNHLYNNIQFYK